MRRYFFDSLESAALALLLVLKDSREGDRSYTFGPLSAQAILASGLRVSGEIEDLVPRLEKIPGSIGYDDSGYALS